MAMAASEAKDKLAKVYLSVDELKPKVGLIANGDREARNALMRLISPLRDGEYSETSLTESPQGGMLTKMEVYDSIAYANDVSFVFRFLENSPLRGQEVGQVMELVMDAKLLERLHKFSGIFNADLQASLRSTLMTVCDERHGMLKSYGKKDMVYVFAHDLRASLELAEEVSLLEGAGAMDARSRIVAGHMLHSLPEGVGITAVKYYMGNIGAMRRSLHYMLMHEYGSVAEMAGIFLLCAQKPESLLRKQLQ